MRIVAILQYGVGGVVLLTVAGILPDSDPSDHQAYYALGVVALVLAVIRSLHGASMSLTHARASNLAGLLFISAVVAVSEPIGGTPAFYLWPLLTAAYFLPRRDLVVVFVVFVVTFAIALWAFERDGSEAQTYVCTVLVVLVVTALVRVMREALAGLIHDLEATASTDYLTGLANRAAFHRGCERMVAAAVRSGEALSVVMIDLDHFKAINDRFGHDTGDALLADFAAVLRAESRASDLPARIGGEEFVVVLDGAPLSVAVRFAERLRTRIEQETAGDDASITLSAGVATLVPGCDDVAALLREADAALYRAKDAGRNRVESASAAATP